MRIATLILAVSALILGGSDRADADLVVYDNSLDSPDFFDQQSGNNMYYYGDDVTLAPGSARLLDTATLTFTFYTNSGTGSYTPDLALSHLRDRSDESFAGGPRARHRDRGRRDFHGRKR